MDENSQRTHSNVGGAGCSSAGLPIGRNGGLTWHDLRHEYVSHLIDRDVKPTITQKLARHKDLSTTMGYYEAHDAELVAAAAKMAEGREVS